MKCAFVMIVYENAASKRDAANEITRYEVESSEPPIVGDTLASSESDAPTYSVMGSTCDSDRTENKRLAIRDTSLKPTCIVEVQQLNNSKVGSK